MNGNVLQIVLTFWGAVSSSLIYPIIVYQAWNCWKRYPKDRLHLRLIVFALSLLATGQQALFLAIAWHVVVKETEAHQVTLSCMASAQLLLNVLRDADLWTRTLMQQTSALLGVFGVSPF
ncbi:hypothetical protein ACG7TL_001667 [Trametes sanguinea]